MSKNIKINFTPKSGYKDPQRDNTILMKGCLNDPIDEDGSRLWEFELTEYYDKSFIWKLAVNVQFDFKDDGSLIVWFGQLPRAELDMANKNVEGAIFYRTYDFPRDVLARALVNKLPEPYARIASTSEDVSLYIEYEYEGPLTLTTDGDKS